MIEVSTVDKHQVMSSVELLPNSYVFGKIALTDSVEATAMMGQKVFQEKFFYDFSLSKRIPDDHVLRRLREVVDLSGES